MVRGLGLLFGFGAGRFGLGSVLFKVRFAMLLTAGLSTPLACTGMVVCSLEIA